jgi:hypothetical protein
LKKLLRGLLKRPVYAYRRRRDLAVSPLPHHADFLSRIGTDGVNSTLKFPQAWTGESSGIFNSTNPSTDDISGVTKFAKYSASGTFDVLGSGPVQPGYEFKAAGAFGHKYRQPLSPQEFPRRLETMRTELDSAREFLNDDSTETARLLELIANSNYAMVDWHIDVKSGYRWNPDDWWLNQQIGNVPGADIKVPWEISRAHDLVALAIFSNLDKSTGNSATLSLRLLDWIVANPARKGVNWRSTMEVAIRATNWIWALAISEVAIPTSPSLLWIVARSLEQHANFIEQYPDAGGPGASNHYIADMAGLAHIAAALPSHQNAPKWAETAAEGLAEQAELAIQDDGFSYEGSTGYHRFVTELMTHGTLATLRFPGSWPAAQLLNQPQHWQRICKMFEAAENLQKPNVRSPQFGDHDAGRFLKFHRQMSTTGNEESLNHSHLQSLLQGITGEEQPNSDLRNNPEFIFPTLGINPKCLKSARSTFPDMNSAEKKNLAAGTWIGQSGPIWAAVRCFNPDPLAPTGHLHDDALTIELSINGQDILADPGTGVYTSDLRLRNQLRSRSQHTTAGPVEDSNFNSDNLFQLIGTGSTEIQHASTSLFTATYKTKTWALQRTVEIRESGLNINDTFNGDVPWQQVFIFHPEISVSTEEFTTRTIVKLTSRGATTKIQFDNVKSKIDQALFSPHYGTLVPTQRLIITHASPRSNQIKITVS